MSCLLIQDWMRRSVSSEIFEVVVALTPPAVAFAAVAWSAVAWAAVAWAAVAWTAVALTDALAVNCRIFCSFH